MSDPPRCLICAEPCDRADRNVDGSYAHAACLAAHATWPAGKGKRGNLYPPTKRL